MKLSSRIEEVLAQVVVLQEAQKEQLEALADGTGDMSAYVATVAEREALGDVLKTLRQRQRAASIALLQQAEESTAAIAAQAHAARLIARQERDVVLERRLRFNNQRGPYSQDKATERSEIEHDLVDAQEKLLAAEHESRAAGRAWQLARQELEAAMNAAVVN